MMNSGKVKEKDMGKVKEEKDMGKGKGGMKGREGRGEGQRVVGSWEKTVFTAPTQSG